MTLMNRWRRPLLNKVKTPIFQAWGAWSHAFGHPYDFILMLASARSGSTLLAHILTSNPEIFGIGESKIALTETVDCRQITGKNLFYHWRNDLPRSGQERYILDKLVHNYLLDPEDAKLLNDQRVRIIFLLRDPGPTLLSFMRALNVDETAALGYFVSRMDNLALYAQSLEPEKTSLFLTYEDLLQYTQAVLNLLQSYLELQEPLTEQYQVTKTTGIFGLGDNSENIKSGRIITPTKTSTTELTPETLATAQKAYDHCTAILQERCLHVA